ncbi:coiled-coil domain-containing protein [Ilumatobacter coccineus]|uniref:Uncharacterized protein n=1 Tax=Ilumatobacter coccineus (strain NBRC 103263 / KCTC 29153 / YM16-304) TaxID=1313172 RepID=A0A6C7EDJ1_ILUCY|nr:hypothetical protein [Ilumatobacter coccineus]BAN02066.1 hypothetical protein YM304_17520 [Ilumatobacter coccineus YM16-304]
MIRTSFPTTLRTVALTLAVASGAASCASTSSGGTSVDADDQASTTDPVDDGDGDGGRADGDTGSDPVDAPVDDEADGEAEGGADGEASGIRAGDGDSVADPAPVDLEVGAIELTADTDATVSTLDDGRTVVQGTVTVPTAGADVELADADIAVGIGPDGEPSISGTARVPFPTEGKFADAEINQLPIGEMGSAYGRDLAHLGAHLHDDTRYLFFAFDGGLDVSLPFAGEPGYEALPSTIAVPTGVSAALVLDPTDPYFYVGTNCPDLSKDDDEPEQNDDKDRDDSKQSDERDRDQSDDGQNDDESGEAYYTIEPSSLPAGQECGIGISNNGNIPAPATGLGDAFTGHVVVDGIVPLYAGIELDGSAVIALRDPGVRTVGWGDVLATVPLIDSLIDIQIPLADAAVEIQAESTRIGVAYDGAIGGSNPTYELPLVGMPITIPTTGSVEWDARFGFVDDGSGTWRIDPASYAEVSGEFGVGLGQFGELIGMELSDVASQSGSFRIDSTGVTARGQSQLQIHPALRSGAAADYALRIDAADWLQSSLEFVADVELAGHTIAAADVVVGGDGIAVAGEVDFGFARAALSGSIDSTGFELAGEAGIDLSIDGLAEASRSVTEGITSLITEVEQLDGEIDRARAEVRENRRNRDDAFIGAKSFLQNAIDSLDELDSETAEKEARIAELRRKIADEQDWYDGLSAGKKVLEWTAHSARLTVWRGEIATLNVRIFAIDDVYRPAAVGVLTGAQEALDLIQAGLDALPVDTNPKVAVLLLTRNGLIGALELARGTAELFEIEGSLRGNVAMRLASDGIGGSFSGELCGPNRCTALPGGRVELGADTAICVELPGLGEKCLAF